MSFDTACHSLPLLETHVAPSKSAKEDNAKATNPPPIQSLNTLHACVSVFDHRFDTGGNSSRGGGGEDQRPRFFDKLVKKERWAKAETVPGRHPERWRKDAAGNIVCKRFCNCHGCLCFEYDHILPFSKGGESSADNCQILQTRVNRFKSDEQKLNETQLNEDITGVVAGAERYQAQVTVLGLVPHLGHPCNPRPTSLLTSQFEMAALVLLEDPNHSLDCRILEKEGRSIGTPLPMVKEGGKEREKEGSGYK
ncbi:unnamed protein product [Dovyalis caffra]|uniref:HNH domain-containing protein n=1 Tax=Dovyalis caffra TaxID=77055 RepID=A0AAV1R4I8_9ROSI|nr:unnamed protein product [Dovyalis caffra]